MGEASGAGVIFGNTGGVMEAALRTVYAFITGKNPEGKLADLKAVRGYEGVRDAEIRIGDLSIKVAVIHGTANAEKFIKEKQITDYQFVEVMTCPGGCIAGAGTNIALPQAAKEVAKFKAEADRKVPDRETSLNE